MMAENAFAKAFQEEMRGQYIDTLAGLYAHVVSRDGVDDDVGTRILQ